MTTLSFATIWTIIIFHSRRRRRRLMMSQLNHGGKTGPFFAVIAGLRNGFYRKQRSPVDGCFSERWPSEPSPEVCNILRPAEANPTSFRSRTITHIYNIHHTRLDLWVSHCKSQCVSGASLSGRRWTIIYCLPYNIHNGREIFTPKHGWAFSPSVPKANVIFCLRRKLAASHADAVVQKIMCYSESFGLCCIHRVSRRSVFKNIVVRLKFKINFRHVMS